ncbi:MAG: hypothetical protein E7050_08060 [Lentisphaerae bacterium]|nr:hypothetical protein [Lentisphaerota bacterium]
MKPMINIKEKIMNKFIFSAGAVAAILLTGCNSTKTTIFDPARTKTNIRQVGNISSEELREVTLAAVEGAMTNAKFTTFLRKYKNEMNDQDAIPVLKLDRVINNTDDPDLNVDEITDMLNEALINAGKVDVTMAEGVGMTDSIADSRNLKNDANFDQSTVAKKGTLQAARLVLRPKVMSSTISEDGKQVVVRTFVMEMADIKTGLIMWKFTKQLGFIKEQNTFGW